ncbi:MAG TPA: STAS domain-containing protein [Actinomycetota bacterium]
MSELAYLETGRRGDASLVRVHGEIDASNVDELSVGIERASEHGSIGLVVDLSETTYLDSAGIALLFRLAERLRARRQELRLVVPAQAPVRAVLELSGLSAIAPIDPGEDATSPGIPD